VSFATDRQRRWWFAQQDDPNPTRAVARMRDAAAADAWEAGLTAEERKALHDYSFGGGWEQLNEAIRDGHTLTPKQQAMRDAIDRAVAKAPTLSHPETVYRGVRMGRRPTMGDTLGLGKEATAEKTHQLMGDWAETQFPAGKEFDLGGFQSTSADVNPALDASLGKDYAGPVFEIRMRKGAPLHRIANQRVDDEFEFLLGRDTRYRSLGVKRKVPFERPDGRIAYRTVVQVEQVK
jgi:hypothetical protein